MSYNQLIIKNIHKIFRRDPYIQAILGAAGQKLFEIENKINSLSKEFWFDSMSEIGIAVLENQLNYRAKSQTIEGKREELEARWKTAGKCDLALLQTIANSWRNGEVAVLFSNAVIEITFVSIVGIPRDIEVLKQVINEAKPAHLPINYTFRYRTWGLVKNNNWGHYKNYTWEDVFKREGL